MKKYFKPTANVVKLSSSLCQTLAVSGEDKPGGGSRKSNEFEGPTGFLWEDNSTEE